MGGLARFVTRIKELKAESVARGEPEALVLFSGDAFNPSLTSTTTFGEHRVSRASRGGQIVPGTTPDRPLIGHGSAPDRRPRDPRSTPGSAPNRTRINPNGPNLL